MQREALTKEASESLLKEAKNAHAEYEHTPGHRDDDWAAWYVAFIINRLQKDSSITSPGEGLPPTKKKDENSKHVADPS